MEETSLDGLEISQHAGAWALTRPQRRLLRHDAPEQLRIIDAIEASDLPRADRRATRVNCCSQVVSVGAGQDGRPAVRYMRCRDRLCLICCRCRQAKATERLEGMVRSMLSPKLLTLTLAPSPHGLAHQLDRLVTAYRDLRRRKVWKASVRGAAAVIEVTRGANGGHWHVHLHALIDADYIPQHTLSSEWRDCTGDSPVVDIRAIPDGGKAARYLAKYAAKGCQTRNLSGLHLVELVEAMHRRRTLITSGTMHGRPADVDDWEPEGEPVEGTISVARIRAAARHHCQAARRVLELMVLAGGLPALMAAEPGDPTIPLDSRTWTRKFAAEFRQSMRRTAEWLERTGPALLMGPPRYTGDQAVIADVLSQSP